MAKRYIACFDSGVGGLTTLARLRQQLPWEDFIYYADVLHTPYGGRPRKQVLTLTEQAVAQLLPQGLKALVLACNTATSAAAAELRAQLDLPVLGLEPAVKPALAATEGRVVVLGTDLTVREQKFIQLLKDLPRAQRVLPLACPGLVELIEQDPEQPALTHYLEDLLTPHLPAGALVLGCTHYIFLRPLLARLWPQLPVFDGNAGLARHLQRQLAALELLNPGPEPGKLLWQCSDLTAAGQAAFLAKGQYYLGLAEQALAFTPPDN